MSSAPQDFRWIAEIVYRTKSGPVDVQHHFEEISDLHDIVELGPDWNTIISVTVRLNPIRSEFDGDTVEEAEKR